MKQLQFHRRAFTLNPIQTGLLTAGAMLMSSPALAGGGGAGGVTSAMTKANTIMAAASAGMLGLGLATVTIAVMFVGYKMIFRAGQWADLAPVFWGGLLIGGAAALAGGLMGA